MVNIDKKKLMAAFAIKGLLETSSRWTCGDGRLILLDAGMDMMLVDVRWRWLNPLFSANLHIKHSSNYWNKTVAFKGAWHGITAFQTSITYPHCASLSKTVEITLYKVTKSIESQPHSHTVHASEVLVTSTYSVSSAWQPWLGKPRRFEWPSSLG